MDGVTAVAITRGLMRSRIGPIAVDGSAHAQRTLALPADWKRDLMERGATGSLWRIDLSAPGLTVYSASWTSLCSQTPNAANTSDRPWPIRAEMIVPVRLEPVTRQMIERAMRPPSSG